MYALGIIAYQMVTADLATAPGPDAAMEMRDLKIPSELAALIVRSAAMDPNRRPKDATEWEAALAALLQKSQRPSGLADTSVAGSKPVLLPDPEPTERPAGTDTPFQSFPLPPDSRRVVRPDARVEREYERERPKAQKARKLVPVLIGGVLALGLMVGAVISLLPTGKTAKPDESAGQPKGTSRSTEPGPKGDPKIPAPKPKDDDPAPKPKDKTPDPKPKDKDPEPGPVVAKGPAPGETCEVEIAPNAKMTFCWVPAGECKLGSPKAERDAVLKLIGKTVEPDWLRAEAEELRGPYRTSGFWMGKYKVTQAEWAAVMRGTPLAAPSSFRIGGGRADFLGPVKDTSRFPVESVSWEQCKLFLAQANARGGVKKALGKPGALALPHEDAWEYACRGGLGNRQPFYFGPAVNGTQANINGIFPFGTDVKGLNLACTSEVGSYAAKYPHPWGLCDVHGNVMEWCENLYEKTDQRVLRGGSWYNYGHGSRAAYRLKSPPEDRGENIGFRVVLSLDP